MIPHKEITSLFRLMVRQVTFLTVREEFTVEQRTVGGQEPCDLREIAKLQG
jgi:hypothetical protein